MTKRRGPFGLLLAVSLSGIIGPWSGALAATFVVDHNIDGVDMTPGDGRCAQADTGYCTLRAAIQEANALAGPDRV